MGKEGGPPLMGQKDEALEPSQQGAEGTWPGKDLCPLSLPALAAIQGVVASTVLAAGRTGGTGSRASPSNPRVSL